MKYAMVVLFSVLPCWVFPAGAGVMHGTFTGMQVNCGSSTCSPIIGTVDVDISLATHFNNNPPYTVTAEQAAHALAQYPGPGFVTISLTYPYRISSVDNFDSQMLYYFTPVGGYDQASFVTIEAPGTGALISTLTVANSSNSFLSLTSGFYQSFSLSRPASSTLRPFDWYGTFNHSTVSIAFQIDTMTFNSPGSDPGNPIIPDPIVPRIGLPYCDTVTLNPDGTTSCPGYVFHAPPAGDWFDPPAADGFAYSLSSGDFTLLQLPPASFGFGPVKLFIGGIDEGALAPGDTFDFLAHGLPDVSSFYLTGIHPALDTASPDFATAFPIFLDFTGTPDTLTMIPLIADSSVPEPAPVGFLLIGVAGVALVKRRKF